MYALCPNAQVVCAVFKLPSGWAIRASCETAALRNGRHERTSRLDGTEYTEVPWSHRKGRSDPGRRAPGYQDERSWRGGVVREDTIARKYYRGLLVSVANDQDVGGEQSGDIKLHQVHS